MIIRDILYCGTCPVLCESDYWKFAVLYIGCVNEFFFMLPTFIIREIWMIFGVRDLQIMPFSRGLHITGARSPW